MKIAIVGAGVAGVTTAYELARHGHTVTVFERRASAAEETSFAPGAVRGLGGGGLGALAYNEGYIRFKADIMFCAVVVLIVVVQCIQSGGNYLYKKLR